MTTRRHAIAIAASFALLLSAAPALAQEKLKVLATFSILGDLVRNVGGDRVEVTTLVGPNSDAHVYSPAPADAKKVAAARVVVTNGLGFEGWMARLVKASGTKASPVVASKGVKPRRQADSHGHGHGNVDAHAWQSVANVKIYVANIRDALIAADPAGKATYDANAQAYTRQARRTRQGGQGRGGGDPEGPAPDHHLARCLRLFPAGLWHLLHRAAGRIDRVGGVRPRRRAHHHAGQKIRRSRRCFSKTSPTPG